MSGLTWAGPIPLSDAELDDAIVRLVRMYPGRLGRPRIAHIHDHDV